MDAAHQQELASEVVGLSAEYRAIVDFAPARLRDDATLRDALRLFLASRLWGVPIVNRSGQYIGTCTLRNLVACGLPVRRGVELASWLGPPQHSTTVEGRRREQILGRAVGQNLDLEITAVRLSTALPHLLLVLCRGSPIVPIVSNAGRRLLGVASLDRAMRAIYAP
jgi:CBS-domain-containing membrane protein